MTLHIVEEKGTKDQTFSDLARLKQDSWECYPGFIALKSKQSLDPQVIDTRNQSWFYLLYVTVQKKNVFG